MADFIDPLVTARIVAATEKLETQSNRAEVLIDNLETAAPSPVDSVNGQTGVVVLDADDIASGVTNRYMTAAEKSKLSGIEAGAQVNDVTSVNGTVGAVVLDTDDIGEGVNNKYLSASDKTKLNGIEAGAQVNDVTSVNGATGVVVLDSDDISQGSVNKYFPEAPLDGQQYARQSGAWAVVVGGGGGSSVWGAITGILSDQTDLQSALDGKADDSEVTAAAIKTKYESNANTNAYTDAEKTKLAGIAAGAEVNTVDSVFGRSGAVVATAGDYSSAQVSAGASATNYTPTASTVEGHLAGIDTALAGGGGDAYTVIDTATYTNFQDFSTVNTLGSGIYKVLTNISDNAGYLPFKSSGNEPLMIKVYKLDAATYSLEATFCDPEILHPMGKSWHRIVSSAPRDSGWYDPSYVCVRSGVSFTNRWDTYANIETALLQGYIEIGKTQVKGATGVGMPLDSSEFLVELTKIVSSTGSTSAYHMVAWNLPISPNATSVQDQWVRHINSTTDTGWQQISGV